jgi:hypothetical protein
MKDLMQKMDITGIIMPNNWDKMGRIVDIAIYTNTEEVYGVAHNRLREELMNLMYKTVAVTGNIKKHPDGQQSIEVHNFNLLEEMDTDEGKTNATH